MNRGPAAGDESVDDRLQSAPYKAHMAALCAALVRLVAPASVAATMREPSQSQLLRFERVEPDSAAATELGGAEGMVRIQPSTSPSK